MVNGINLHGVRGPAELQPKRPEQAGKSGAFAGELAAALQQQGGVKFSAHALQRLEERGITLSPQDEARIAQALDAAAAKGSRESLLLMDGLALVASVRNRTIITALTPPLDEPTVFTNIDSAVVVAGAEEPASEAKGVEWKGRTL